MVEAGRDPLVRAVELAGAQVRDGELVLADRADRLALALLLQPDEPRAATLQAHYVLQVAAADMLAAILPPMMAVRLDWPQRLLVDGATLGRCRLRIAAAPTDVPAWLVLALDLAIRLGDGEPGERPDRVALAELGVADQDAAALAERLTRHFLTWIDRWHAEGFAPVRRTWNAYAAAGALDRAGAFEDAGRRRPLESVLEALG
jgi:BirA family biotin operon repressor/biotin-[acetyl-CoA-carboxylase] ligase